MNRIEPLDYRRIFRFWLPLLATWLMMAVEGPLLAAVIARLADAKINLAAYGVAYSFALVAESPVIMLMSASTALSGDREGYRRLRNFALILAAGVTLFLLVLVVPPVFRMVVEELIGLPHAVAALTRQALLVLLPWPAAIGLRRFYQGVLIRHNRTRRVAAATVVRVTAMAFTATLLALTTGLAGARVGAVALAIGVTGEALATRLLASGAIAALPAQPPAGATPPPAGYRALARFYLPLALTPFIALCVQPAVTFFLGQGRRPLESLAVMPVIYALTFVFRAVGLSFQEVAIALVGERFEQLRPVLGFAALVGGGATLLLGLIAYTPLATLWFGTVSGLSPALAAFAVGPLRILAVQPALTVLLGTERSLLVVGRTTGSVSLATALETAGILILLMLLLRYSPLAGAMAAAIAYIAGRLLSVGFLALPALRLVRERRAGSGLI